jgi:hypothetical protein
MAEAATPVPSANLSAGHLSVRVEDAHAVDVPFMFEQPAKRMAPAATASFLSHVLFVVLVVLCMANSKIREHSLPVSGSW